MKQLVIQKAVFIIRKKAREIHKTIIQKKVHHKKECEFSNHLIDYHMTFQIMKIVQAKTVEEIDIGLMIKIHLIFKKIHQV